MAEWLMAAALKAVEGASSPWVQILLPPPLKLNIIPGEMAEPAEGARLLSECVVKAAPRVRIPLSPPIKYKPDCKCRAIL